ncbi:dihydrofolate reductase [Ideonella sp. A 288]|uniref:dihydrofolate reductase n=1 Tax=Ideonella sp. A 288 TaxID=1962181 RepID=UPI000B4B503A|nr:dihydrofolate reductase [Ideonella sp. A 288]
MTRLALIAAVARNGVIGHDNQLLWRLPEDLKHLRARTMGCPVVMGRKTWDSLPPKFRPLPGRHNIVVTRQAGWQAEGATVAHSLAEALTAAGDVPRVWVIGGAELYAAAMPLADELALTEIDADFTGDVHFPPWVRDHFTELSRVRHRAAPPNDFDYSFVDYRRA